MTEALILSFAARSAATPLQLEVASLARTLVREFNRTLALAVAEVRSADRVRALEEAKACIELLRALREQHSWLVLDQLDEAEIDIGRLQSRFARRGDYDIAGRGPTDAGDAFGLASLLAPLLANASGNPPTNLGPHRSSIRPRRDQQLRRNT